MPGAMRWDRPAVQSIPRVTPWDIPSTRLTALAREQGLEDCQEAVEARVRDYEQRLRLWMDREKTDRQDWAVFLQK